MVTTPPQIQFGYDKTNKLDFPGIDAELDLIVRGPIRRERVSLDCNCMTGKYGRLIGGATSVGDGGTL